MPTYQYSCTACGEALEAVQSFTDPALTVCPECGGQLRKVYSAVGVVFKGSGFYKTDSRAAAKSAAAKSEAKSEPKSDAKSDGKTAGGSDPKPAGKPTGNGSKPASPPPTTKSGGTSTGTSAA